MYVPGRGLVQDGRLCVDGAALLLDVRRAEIKAHALGGSLLRDFHMNAGLEDSQCRT